MASKTASKASSPSPISSKNKALAKLWQQYQPGATSSTPAAADAAVDQGLGGLQALVKLAVLADGPYYLETAIKAGEGDVTLGAAVLHSVLGGRQIHEGFNLLGDAGLAG